MGASRPWTNEAILEESERWVHVPPNGVLVSDERRLLVNLPGHWSTSRVWRSWVSNEQQALELIGETTKEVRAAGNTKLVWHTGDRVAPAFMDGCLARFGFEVTEDLEVLAFELGSGPEPTLPRLRPHQKMPGV